MLIDSYAVALLLCPYRLKFYFAKLICPIGNPTVSASHVEYLRLFKRPIILHQHAGLHGATI